MGNVESSQRIQEWMNEIATTGRISISHSPRRYLIQFGIPIAIVIILFVVGALSGEVETAALVFGVGIVPVLLMLLALFLFSKQKGKEMVFDQHGFSTLDGQRIAWEDVEKADIFRSSRAEPTVRILVSDSVWNEYLSRQSTPGRWLNKFNTEVTKKNGIYLPHQLDAEPEDIEALVNFFATGAANQP